MKQHNRVQLSFPSIIKIFAVYGLALDVVFILLYLPTTLIGSDIAAWVEFTGALILCPLLFVLVATLGYPFFALINRARGGLMLTVVRTQDKSGN